MYGDIDEDCILYQMGEIFREFEEGTQSNAVLIRKVYTQIKRLLTVATDFGFDKNLWHNYLAYFLITNENPFSITCEKVGAQDGSVNEFVKDDFDENTDDILDSINKMIQNGKNEKNEEKSQKDEKNDEN